MQPISEAAEFTLKFINQTNRSLFLTGKAGTGKTTLLKEIIKTTHKNTVVVAPTGIAALNAGGVTIHSMFQLPFGGFIPDNSVPHFSERVKFETKNTLVRHFKMSGLKKSVIRNMELMIIDEVSMLRADLLDAIDFMMQSVRKKKAPFGGVQVLFIGDLLQLPPVIRDEEWSTLRKYYNGKFFFHSQVIQQNPPLYIELSKIFRQSDDVFISILNNLRNNQISNQDIAVLNQYVNPNFDLNKNKGYIILTTHNAKADTINAKALDDLDGKLMIFNPEIVDDFPDKIYPIEHNLQLKIGAQIMFVKNDPSIDKQYFNGKMGFIKSLSSNEILVHFPDENLTIEVEKFEWQNIRYKINQTTKEIEEEIVGTFVHYPIKLAWAITVHKSQGLTFDKAVLDVSQVFVPGQAYVALSRLRSLNGLILLSQLQMNGISNDQDVMDYSLNKASEEVLAQSLQQDTKKYLHNYLKATFDWSDLAQEWRNHQFSYNEKAEVSEKSKHAVWAKKQAECILEILDPSKKFLIQLDKLFAAENFDINQIAERIHAAYNYFFVTMDRAVYDILWKLEEVKRAKKAKAYFEELMLLEEMQIKAVFQLMKAKLLINTVASGAEISKENLTSNEIISYRNNKIFEIQTKFKELNISIVEDDVDVNRFTKKKNSKTAAPKKSTTQESYELWLQSNSINEIAAIRKLTPQTIYSHFAKLIEAGQVQLQDVMPEDKIEALTLVFKGFKGESLNELMEVHGDKFTWNDMRLFKAAIGK